MSSPTDQIRLKVVQDYFRLADHALVDFVVSTFGRIDVLFNNAAMAYFNWIEDISASDESSHVTGGDIVVDGGMRVW
jgi:NADP-dependent 3-hydroxy acid dehydrogenase YdfG